MVIIPQNLPLFWDKQTTIVEAWYLKAPKPAEQGEITIDDPPIPNIQSALLDVRDQYGGTERFAPVAATVTAGTGLISFEIANNVVASASWKESWHKVIVTIAGKPYVFFKGRVTLGY